MYLSAIGGVFIYLGAIGRFFDDKVSTGIPSLSIFNIVGLFIFLGCVALSYHTLTLFMEFNFEQGKRTRVGSVLTMLGSIVLAGTVDIFLRNSFYYLAHHQQRDVPVYRYTESTYILALNVIVLQTIKIVRTVKTVAARFIVISIMWIIAAYYLLTFDRSIVDTTITTLSEQLHQFFGFLTGQGTPHTDSTKGNPTTIGSIPASTTDEF